MSAFAFQFTSEYVLAYCILHEVCLVLSYLFLLTACNIICLNKDNKLVAFTAYLLHAYQYGTWEDLVILHVHTPFL